MHRFLRSILARRSDYSALILFAVAYLSVLALVIAPDQVRSAFHDTARSGAD